MRFPRRGIAPPLASRRGALSGAVTGLRREYFCQEETGTAG